MDGLHLLSFLLTADQAKAEECFVSGLEDCADGTYVFRDWAQSWARRTIIKNAIRMLAPRKNHSTVVGAPSDAVTCSFGRTKDTDYSIARILQLEHFERFVFVMSVLKNIRSAWLLAAGCWGNKNASVAASRGARQVTHRGSVRVRLQRS